MMEAKDRYSANAMTSGRLAGDEFPLRLHEPPQGMPGGQACDAPRAKTPAPRMNSGGEFRARRLASDIITAVQGRLPGRIRDLKVRIDGKQFVLSGVSSSYYVKQMAQHIAMTAIEAVMLGQLVNEIEVRTPR